MFVRIPSWFHLGRILLLVFGCLGLASSVMAQFTDQVFFRDMVNNALPRVPNTALSTGAPSFPTTAPPGTPGGYSAAGATPTATLAPGAGSGWQSSARPRDWTLGVALDNIDTGAIVRQVQSNSPAQRAGLEVGDIIVALGGAQVGYVEGRLNDVGDQIRRSADVNGRVRAVVWDGRTSRLQVVEINLESASEGIVGSVSLRDRGNLPYGSILKVQLENATRSFYEVNGGTSTQSVYGGGPFPFEIHYDPRYIDPRDQYRLTAVVTTANGQLIYALRQPLPVPAGGFTSSLRLEVESLRDLQSGGQGGVIQASYPADPNALNQVYQQLLNRLPSTKEQVAWSSYLAQGNSIDDLKVKILASPNYYDRVGNNPTLFVQSIYQSLIGRSPSPQEVAAWTARLQQYQGQREEFVREFMQQVR